MCVCVLTGRRSGEMHCGGTLNRLEYLDVFTCHEADRRAKSTNETTNQNQEIEPAAPAPKGSSAEEPGGASGERSHFVFCSQHP